MEKQIAGTCPGTTIAALARDGDGNTIQLPESASGWRIRRQTGGRPRLHLDSRKQPMVFPLDYTIADAEDVLPPGSYRLDLVDSNGESLEMMVPLTVGMPRNADGSEQDRENGASAAAPISWPTSSEIRTLLEANVRAMQMAFLHNQKLLEIGARIVESLRDSVQALATSQADWIKSVALSRGAIYRGGLDDENRLEPPCAPSPGCATTAPP